MSEKNCHGCDGKGWILICRSERVTPFLSEDGRQPVGNAGVQNREFQAVYCPICKGRGKVAVASREDAP
jgi:RecJ-like exonuclease